MMQTNLKCDYLFDLYWEVLSSSERVYLKWKEIPYLEEHFRKHRQTYEALARLVMMTPGGYMTAAHPLLQQAAAEFKFWCAGCTQEMLYRDLLDQIVVYENGQHVAKPPPKLCEVCQSALRRLA